MAGGSGGRGRRRLVQVHGGRTEGHSVVSAALAFAHRSLHALQMFAITVIIEKLLPGIARAPTFSARARRSAR